MDKVKLQFYSAMARLYFGRYVDYASLLWAKFAGSISHSKITTEFSNARFWSVLFYRKSTVRHVFLFLLMLKLPNFLISLFPNLQSMIHLFSMLLEEFLMPCSSWYYQQFVIGEI